MWAEVVRAEEGAVRVQEEMVRLVQAGLMEERERMATAVVQLADVMAEREGRVGTGEGLVLEGLAEGLDPATPRAQSSASPLVLVDISSKTTTLPAESFPQLLRQPRQHHNLHLNPHLFQQDCQLLNQHLLQQDCRLPNPHLL